MNRIKRKRVDGVNAIVKLVQFFCQGIIVQPREHGDKWSYFFGKINVQIFMLGMNWLN